MRLVITTLLAISMIMVACKKKEKIEFILNSITLKAVNRTNLPNQNFFIKVIKEENSSQTILATTDKYPSEFTLPAKFGMEYPLKMNLYKNTYFVALYGDSTGFIGMNPIHIKDYKILYPLDMETEKDGLSIILTGTWR